eukprot:XP_015153898.1 uncharacterized protein LOC107055111 [Gallus gallus]
MERGVFHLLMKPKTHPGVSCSPLVSSCPGTSLGWQKCAVIGRAEVLNAVRRVRDEERPDRGSSSGGFSHLRSSFAAALGMPLTPPVQTVASPAVMPHSFPGQPRAMLESWWKFIQNCLERRLERKTTTTAEPGHGELLAGPISGTVTVCTFLHPPPAPSS